MSPLNSPTAIFVYGTLKRGQLREQCWPCPPLGVEPATVRGALYDLVEYPAMVPGEDQVLGEVWQLAPEDLPRTLRVLDDIEDFHDAPTDLYLRRIVSCQLPSGEVCSAWTYLYHRAEMLSASARIRPDANGLCHWPVS